MRKGAFSLAPTRRLSAFIKFSVLVILGDPGADSGAKESRNRGPFLESPDNFSGPESYFMSARFTLKIQNFVGF